MMACRQPGVPSELHPVGGSPWASAQAGYDTEAWLNSSDRDVLKGGCEQSSKNRDLVLLTMPKAQCL